MMIRPRAHLLVPLLALSLTVATASTGQAQDRYSERSSGTSASLRISFGSTPHWTDVRGTGIRRIRDGDRTDYDIFRYGRRYYAYNDRNDRWYRSRNWRGEFRLIDDRSVPWELRRLPRQHWRNYPSAWEVSDSRGSYGSSGFLQVSFGSAPRWSGISGTRVEAIYGDARPNYDVFRYGGSYYAYSNDRWYMSNRESGRFTLIDDRQVPTEFSRVPRQNWRNYPAGWYGDNDGPGNSNGRRNSRGRNDQHGNGRGGN